LSRHHSGLSQDDLSASADLEFPGYGFNGRDHVIDDDSLLLRSVVVEAGRPALEGLEAEGEGVLPRGEA
jgi:hypothetical protein